MIWETNGRQSLQATMRTQHTSMCCAHRNTVAIRPGRRTHPTLLLCHHCIPLQIRCSNCFHSQYSGRLQEFQELHVENKNSCRVRLVLARSARLTGHVQLPGMSPANPLSPYPYEGEMISFAFSPTFMVAIPSSHPRMTAPTPNVKAKGRPRLREESNSLPSRSWDVRCTRR